MWGGKVRNRGPVFETISEIYEQKLAQAKRENQPADKIAELAGIWPVMKVSTETPAAGAEVEAEVRASDPDGDALEYVWVLLQESATYGVADTGLAMPRGFEDAIVAGQGTPRVKAVLPGGGVYRLFCYVFDKAPDGRRKSVATACRPLKGAGAPPKVTLPPSALPKAVYKDCADSPWIPSGYMGSDLSKFSVDTKCTDNPHSGETCMKVKWTDGGGWAGLNWQSPANDWGDAPGGANVTGARFRGEGLLPFRRHRPRPRLPGQRRRLAQGPRAHRRVEALPHRPGGRRPLLHQDRLRLLLRRPGLGEDLLPRRHRVRQMTRPSLAPAAPRPGRRRS